MLVISNSAIELSNPDEKVRQILINTTEQSTEGGEQLNGVIMVSRNNGPKDVGS